MQVPDRRVRGEDGGLGFPPETNREWAETLSMRARSDYFQQRESLAEGALVAIRLEGKLLLLTPRLPGDPAPESGDVPVVEALLAEIIDVRPAIHPDQSLELLVKEVLGLNRPGQ